MTPWANGLGTTAVIAREPDADEWAWRLSIADVSTDGPFSALPGIDRWIAVASGVGMVLTVDGVEHVLTPESGAFAFDGGAVTTCRLLDGPIHDLNLMLRRGAATGSINIVTVGHAAVTLSASALVVLDGTLHLAGDALDPGDAHLAPSGPATGPARIALIRTAPP